MNDPKKVNKFLAEGFIQKLDTNLKVVFNTQLSDENLKFNRELCAMKYMARMGVNISLSEATEYVESEEWKSLWAGVWACPPSPGKSVSVFFYKPI